MASLTVSTHDKPPLKRYRSFFNSVEYAEVEDKNIGSGAFGNIRYAKNTSTNLGVAIKVVKRNHAGSERCMKRELEFLKRIKAAGGHENLMELIDCAFDTIDTGKSDVQTCLVLPKCEFTLREWMNHAYKEATEVIRVEITRQVYAGIDFLQRVGIIHCDLHLSNVMVHKFSGQIKIGDFGAAQRNSGYELTRYKLRELRATTYEIVIPIWLGYHHMSNNIISKARQDHGKRKGVSSELIDMAEKIIMDRPMRAYFVALSPEMESWADEVHHIEGLANTIEMLMSWTFTKPSGRHGIPIPNYLWAAMQFGCILGPDACVTSDSILKLCTHSISPSEQEWAQDKIREITSALKTTEV